jgi:PKD repeat protein
MRRTVIVAVAVVAVLAAAAPAAAKLVRVPSGRVISIAPRPGPTHRGASRNAPPGAHLDYLGGAVLHTNNTVAIFWDPQPYSSPSFKALATRYLGDAAHDSGSFGNDYSVATQYGDASGPISYQSTFEGADDDTHAYPTTGSCTPAAPADASEPCVTDTQIQDEINAEIGLGHVPGASGNTIYFVFLPQNVVTCGGPLPKDCSDYPLGGFCGYHEMSSGKFPYAVILDDPPHCGQDVNPNDANVDGALSTVSHEHIEAITDPNPSAPAWADTGNQNEIADECPFDYGAPLGGTGSTAFNELVAGHEYELQQEFSDVDATCVQYYPALQPDFTTTQPIAGQPTGFAPVAQRNPHAAFAWTFGDGASAAGPAPSHAYAAPGNYGATLTVLGDAGRSAAASKVVSAAIPPPVAAFRWAHVSGRHRVRFDARGSQAPFESITAYAWRFDDGAAASGAVVAHSFRRAGDHTVTLAITTSAGASSAITQRVPVDDPAASFSFSGRRRMRQRLAFSARASDPDGHVTRFRWDFGDGRHASGRRAAHAFAQGGTYPVALTVTDSDRSSTTVTRRLRIGYVPPRAAVRVPRQSLASVVAHGLRVAYSADEPGRGVVKLEVPTATFSGLGLRAARNRVIARLVFRAAVGRGGRAVMPLPPANAGRLSGVRRLALLVEFVLTNGGRQTGVARQTITLR